MGRRSGRSRNKHNGSRGNSSRSYYGDSISHYESGYSGSGIGYNRTRTSSGGWGGSYGGGSSRSGGGGSSWGKSWSWGNFGGSFSSWTQDDDTELTVKDNPMYFTPKRTEIERLNSGHYMTQTNIDLVKDLSRFFYHRMIEDKDYFDKRFDDLSSVSSEEAETYINRKAMFEDLWDKYVPGYTPLEKAMTIFETMNQISKPKDGNFKPSLAKKTLESMSFEEGVYGDPIYNELIDQHALTKNYKVQLMNLLSLIKNFGSEFKVEKEVEEKQVANSRIMKKKILRDYASLANIDLYQRLLPNFDLKMLTKDLVMNIPVEKTEHKQKIIILLDYSGSMHNDEKQQWVVALLMDRLRYAIKEEAEIFFSYFLHEEHWMHFHHIYNKETAMNFWKSFSTMPSGGDTQLGIMVKYIGEQIAQGRLHNLNIDLRKDKPEILAINDGQDSVKTNSFTYKTNAVSLYASNSQLKNMCVANNGKYIYATSHEIVTSSKEGNFTTALKAPVKAT